MDANLKAKWVEALRSDKYKQIAGTLREGDQFCCLGVLCDVMGARWTSHGDAYVDGDYQSSLLSTRMLQNIGLSEAAQSVLYGMNDSGRPFPAIADYIERKL